MKKQKKVSDRDSLLRLLTRKIEKEWEKIEKASKRATGKKAAPTSPFPITEASYFSQTVFNQMVSRWDIRRLRDIHKIHFTEGKTVVKDFLDFFFPPPADST